MSVLIDISDAVVTRLNAGGFSVPFEAERTYLPIHTLPELDKLKVLVVPKSEGFTKASRSEDYADYAVDVGIQKKVNVEDKAELDALMKLREEIADHLRRGELEGVEASWVSLTVNPAFSTELLDKERVFLSVVTVTYRARR